MISRRLETRLLVFLALLGFLLPVPPHDHAGAQNDGDHEYASSLSQHYHVDGAHETGNTKTAPHHTSTPDHNVRAHSHSISSSGSTPITLTEKPELELTKKVLFPWTKPAVCGTISEATQTEFPSVSPGRSRPDVILLNQTFLL